MLSAIKIILGSILIIASIWLFMQDGSSNDILPVGELTPQLADHDVEMRANRITSHLDRCSSLFSETRTIAVVSMSIEDCYPCVNEVAEYVELLQSREIPVFAVIRSTNSDDSDRFIKITKIEFDCYESAPIENTISNSIFFVNRDTVTTTSEILLSPNRTSSLEHKVQVLHVMLEDKLN